MPSTATMSGPLTPAKQIARFSDAMGLRDSPFSDYFTDDARSIEHNFDGAAYEMPSSQTQQMLVRLNKLQAQLMRAGEDGGDALNIVGRKLKLDDSGLFMDDDDEPAATTPARASTAEAYFGGLDGAVEEAEDDVTPEEKAAERDYQLVEAQRVLDNVTRAQEELRKRHAELVQLNDDRAVQIEDYQQEVERLRSENESLKSDLGVDHNELLFLKLQLKSPEVGEEEETGDQDESHKGPSSRRSRMPRSTKSQHPPREQQKAGTQTSRPAYTDQSTQTSPNNSTSTCTQLDTPRPPFNRPHLSNSSDDDDDDTASECAITTSSPTPLTQSPLIPPRKAVLTRLPNLPPLPLPLPAPAAKTAWRELWEGLNSFAGMAGVEDEGGEGRR
ncbi:hypothetical protein LTR86_007450 [Recurvomyces mirabilis]|nr:hypothetical protein LTR86_007450 [Recurvomyces mirabilis]